MKGEVIHYVNHKVNGDNYGMAWKPVIPLAATRNAISEAMNVLYKVKIKCEDAEVARASHIFSPSKCIHHTCSKWFA